MGGSPSPPGANGSTKSPDGPSSYLGVHTINIFVRDQERSVRFYVDQLGFHVAFDAQLQSGDRWVAVAPPDGSALLALIAPKPDSRDYRLIGRPTGVVLVTENVIAKYGEWRRRGVLFQYAPRLRRVEYKRREATPCPIPTVAADEQSRMWGTT